VTCRDRPTLLSLNRFEGKKNVALAIEAFHRARPEKEFDQTTRLVIGGEWAFWQKITWFDYGSFVTGGFDDKLEDNIQTLARLCALCDRLGLSHVTLSNPTGSKPITASSSTNVVFLLNFTTAQRSYLLLSPRTLGLLYTPQNEHFGIVPVEAMACGLPVLAVNNGGPTETLVDSGPDMSSKDATGLLREPTVESWAEGLKIICQLSPEQRARIGEAGKRRVREMFSLDTLGKEMEDACVQARSMGSVGTEDAFVLLVGTVSLFTIMLLMGLVLPFL
jgi:alpha-1,3/alpha-1,6-mannosyltransferase